MAEKKSTNRADAVELVDMALGDLKKVAGQLGIENASTLKKADLVQSIGDLQAANREAAKNEREARRMERQNNRNSKNNNTDSEDNDSDSDSDNNSNNSSNNSSNSYNNSDRGDNNRRFGNRDNNRRDRGRDRNRDRGNRGNREEREIVIGPDDVLLPVGGLLDILDSFAFIRTGGYLPSPNDVYVSLQQVRKYGLRKGDVITGSVREPKEGERREKFSALVKVETVNGVEPENAKERVDRTKCFNNSNHRFNLTNW